MTLYVKNMVCNRCIMVVKQELEKMKLKIVNVSMGEVELVIPASAKQLSDFSVRLQELGFELLDDQKQKQIEKVKEWLVYGELSLNEISYKLGYSSVSHLSAQFKKITGLTPSDFKKMGGSRKSLDNL